MAAWSGSATGSATAIQKSFTAVIDPVFDLLVSADGYYEDADLVGMERPKAEAGVRGRALSQLATEDAEVALALKWYSNYFDRSRIESDSAQAKVHEWMDSGHTVVNNDPEVVPGLV